MDNHDTEILEEEPLLLIRDTAIGSSDIIKENTKSATLNTGLPFTGTLDTPKTSPYNKKAMTYAPRGLSLATRANIDPFVLIENAKRNCKQPIKLSWENLTF